MRIAHHPVTLALIVGLAAVAGACQSRPADPPTPPPVSPDVWAVVDGREIRRDVVEKAYRRLAPPNTPVPEDEAMVAKINLLDQLIAEDILVAKANALKITVPEADVDAAFNEGKKNIPDDAFNKELTTRNLTVADMREATRRDLLSKKLIEQEVTSKVTVTDQEVNDFFEANKAQFNLTEDAVHLVQMVVTPTPDAGLSNRTGDDATTAQAAAAKVQMLMDRLKGGAAFAELAMDYSEEPQSAPRGGDVGLVPVSSLRQAPRELRDAVAKLEPGGVSVVPMEGGYTIVGLVARQAAGQRDLNTPEVREGITATLRGRREQLLRAAYLGILRNEAEVVNHAAKRIVESKGMLPSTTAAAPGK